MDVSVLKVELFVKSIHHKALNDAGVMIDGGVEEGVGVYVGVTDGVGVFVGVVEGVGVGVAVELGVGFISPGANIILELSSLLDIKISY
jgi:hypothetical protein